MNSKVQFVVDSLIALCCLVFTSFCWRNNALLTGILVILAIIQLGLTMRKEDLLLFLIVGILGAGAEMFAINRGVWTYNNPDFLNIPFWLVILWGCASVYVSRIYLMVRKREKIRIYSIKVPQ